jgi:lysophospholipase L1-like esterase
MSRSTRLKIGLLCASLLFCFGLAELVARVSFARSTTHLGVEMWKYARAVKELSPDPAIGHRHRANSHARLMSVDVKINVLGLRDVERAVPKPPSVRRVIVLGDSITFGWGVPFEDTYCRQLERGFAGERIEFVNTGVGNTNTAMQAAWFRAEGIKLQPDLVLVGWFINDAEPTPGAQRGWFAKNSCAFAWVDQAFDSLLRNAGNRQTYREFYRGLYTETQPGWLACQRGFRDLAALCAEGKIPLAVGLVPELHSLGANYEFRDVHAKVAALLHELRVPSVELLDAFPTEGDPARFWVTPTDAHPNSAAHQHLAEGFARAIREGKWLP